MNKEYMVNGKTLVLPELTVEKYCAIIALVFGEGEINIVDATAKGPLELIGTRLNVLLGIILEAKDAETDKDELVNKMPFKKVHKIAMDFFTENDVFGAMTEMLGMLNKQNL